MVRHSTYSEISDTKFLILIIYSYNRQSSKKVPHQQPGGVQDHRQEGVQGGWIKF